MRLVGSVQLPILRSARIFLLGVETHMKVSSDLAYVIIKTKKNYCPCLSSVGLLKEKVGTGTGIILNLNLNIIKAYFSSYSNADLFCMV
jgi:hypothetical protein